MLGFQPVESTSPFKVLVSDVNLHPYITEFSAAFGDAPDQVSNLEELIKVRAALQVEHTRSTPRVESARVSTNSLKVHTSLSSCRFQVSTCTPLYVKVNIDYSVKLAEQQVRMCKRL